jgi:hypothetical protein
MPRKPPPAKVTTRALAPEVAQEIPAGLLYQPVPQLKIDPKRPPFDVSYEFIQPTDAEALLNKAMTTSDFRQRKISAPEVKRFADLIATDRFVHFLPNGVILIDPDGVPINGQHRLMAIIETGMPAGFVVFRNVPRWMFSYLDTGRRRTLKDVLHINSRPSGPQTDSMMKLALRYEEFLQGVRPGTGWRHWNAVKDEHQDIDSFYARREDLQRGYQVAQRVYAKAKVLVPSSAAFLFYQSLAWPDGTEETENFLGDLISGTHLIPTRPAYRLREFTLEVFENKSPVIAKREVHLLLLMRAFALEMNQTRVQKLPWAYGQPMAMPYHPKGHDVAIKNVRTALDDMDAGISA